MANNDAQYVEFHSHVGGCSSIITESVLAGTSANMGKSFPGSLDATMSLEEAVEGAKSNGVGILGITDHNDMRVGIAHMDAYNIPRNSVFFDIDGVQVTIGVEGTVSSRRFTNKWGSPAKNHLIGLGFNREEDSNVVQLMDIKRQSDIDNDFGLLFHLLQQSGTTKKVTAAEVREFMKDKIKNDKLLGLSHLYLKLIQEFFKLKDITVSKSYKSLAKSSPKYQRLNIDETDFSKVVHSEGGVVIWAHPSLNLIRIEKSQREAFVRHMFREVKIDGVEVYYKDSIPECDNLIMKVAKELGLEHKLLISGGSDVHFSPHNVGMVESKRIPVAKVKKLVDALGARQTYFQEHGEVGGVFRTYPKEKARDIVTVYRNSYRELTRQALEGGLPEEMVGIGKSAIKSTTASSKSQIADHIAGKKKKKGKHANHSHSTQKPRMCEPSSALIMEDDEDVSSIN